MHGGENLVALALEALPIGKLEIGVERLRGDERALRVERMRLAQQDARGFVATRVVQQQTEIGIDLGGLRAKNKRVAEALLCARAIAQPLLADAAVVPDFCASVRHRREQAIVALQRRRKLLALEKEVREIAERADV